MSAVSRLSLILNQILFPEILRGARKVEPAQWRRLVWTATIATSVTGVALVVAGFVLADELVTVVAGAAYAGSAFCFAILMIAECLGLGSLHLNAVIQEKAGTLPLVRIATIGLLVHLPGTILLGRYAGLEGVAVAVAASAALVYGLVLVTTTKVLRP